MELFYIISVFCGDKNYQNHVRREKADEKDFMSRRDGHNIVFQKMIYAVNIVIGNFDFYFAVIITKYFLRET